MVQGTCFAMLMEKFKIGGVSGTSVVEDGVSSEEMTGRDRRRY